MSDAPVVSVTYVERNGKVHTVAGKTGSSLMHAAIEALVPGIAADCGGNLSCATCHCYVDEAWIEQLDVVSEDERLMLEGVIDPKPTSRLSCQVKLVPVLDGLRVYLPESQ